VPESVRTIAQVATFLVKAFLLVFVVIWIRWTVPRIRIDQMMNLCWKYLVPISFANLIGTAVWVAFVPRGGVLAQAMSLALFALAMVVLGWFVARVRYNLRSTEAQISLNPFV